MWYYKLGHIHPTPSQIAKKTKNKPRIIDLLPSRQEILKEAVIKMKRSRAASDICSVLNKDIDLTDSKQFIFPEQVIEAKEKWVYTQDVKCFEDICNRKDLNCNRRGETYVRVYRNLPIFIFQFCSDWQITILRQLSTGDQAFVEGPFNICPNGVMQMVTLLVKRRSWCEAVPVIHTLLKGKNEATYREMWSCICMLATDPRNGKCYLQEYPIIVSADFEIAMHNAIRALLPKSRIIGCNFHMRQAIFRNVLKSKFGDNVKHDMEYKENRIDLLTRINNMMCCNDMESLVEERTKFILYYKMKAGYELFVDYMIRNWIGTNEKPAKFSYKIWTKCCDPDNCDLHMTNNLIELFHKNINSKFSSKPNLKRFIEILQDIEEDFFAKKQRLENMIELLPVSNPSKHSNTCHSEQPAKKRRTQNIQTTATDPTLLCPTMIPQPMPNSTSLPFLVPLLLPSPIQTLSQPSAHRATQEQQKGVFDNILNRK